jgi:hypothetical protein
MFSSSPFLVLPHDVTGGGEEGGGYIKILVIDWNWIEGYNDSAALH